MSVKMMMRAALVLAAAMLSLPVTRAAAQVQAAPPPTHYTLDARGVDLIHGTFHHTATDVVIGNPGQGGLSYSRTWVGHGWRSNLMGAVAYVGSAYTVSIGSFSDRFTLVGSTYVPALDRGQTLTLSGTTFTYTSADGTVTTFSPNQLNSQNEDFNQNGGVIRAITYPSGEVVNFTYVRGRVLMPAEWPEKPYYLTSWRLQSVTNTLGYQLKLEYLNNNPTTEDEFYDFKTLVRVTGFNMAVDACAPEAVSCTFSRTWPSATAGNHVTDELGRTTVYTAGYTNGFTGIRWPSSSSGNDVTVAYASNRVSSVTVGSDTWTYGYVDAGGNRSTTVTDPLGHTNVVVSNLTTGRATSSRDGLNRTTTFLWDAQGRPTRTTLPEGNYTEWTYGVRGNITQVIKAEKPGTPDLPNIVTSATFPATCTNIRTCNQPTATTDERGNVTNYTYDATHGGVLTVAQPAPTVGANRPQTRISYSSLYAWYKNSTGTLTQAPTPVWRPTAVSACATGTAPACVGTANEVKTTVVYGASGAPNNLLPTSSTSGDGTGALAATSTTTYTANGDVETIDGPLPSSGDLTRYRYDVGRQLIGVIGPDPDGGGTLLHRAIRNTYNGDGQVTMVEQGTVTSQSDTAWSAFSSLQQTQTVYDDVARPVLTAITASGAIYGLQQNSYDAAHRLDCTAVRMNPATFNAPPASACTAATAGTFGPDRIVRNAYDAADQLTAVTTAYGLPAEAITESATYALNGFVVSLTDGQSNVSVQEYDRFDRLSLVRYPNATGGGASVADYEEYTYDPASNLTSYRDRSGQLFAASYDALGRMATSNPPSLDERVFAYDNLGRLTGLSTTSIPVWSFNWTWDALGRRLTEGQGLGTMTSQYDLAGRRTRLTWPDGYYATYDYNLYNALTAVRENGATSGAGVLATYAYDNRGQRIATTRGNGVPTTWGYDAISRLSSLTHDPSGTAQDLTVTFSHNPAGQIVWRTVTNPAYIYAPSDAGTTYVNDGLNRVTSAGGAAIGYDTRGNITSGLGSTFGYDAENNLTAAGTATFRFDPLGRLERSVAAATTRFLYDGVQAVGEYNAAGSVVTARYVPGAGLDDIVATYTGSGTANRTWLLSDERGSVIGLGNGTGAVSINRYDEYGMPAAGNSGRFQYTGQMWLPDAGLYNYRARTYAPQLGRFMQTDPTGYADGANLYIYANIDPINKLDPSGEAWKWACSIPTGGVWQCAWQYYDTGGWDRVSRFEYGRWGYEGRGGPVTNTPEFERFDRERRRLIRENSWMVGVALAPVVVPIAAEAGGSAAVSGTVRLFGRACKCFVAGTPVHLANGPRRIEDIRLGDMVLARDEATGETSYRAVTALISGEERAIWEVVIETIDSDGNARRETIGTTTDHPWRLVGGTWVETAELHPGEELITADGRRAWVVSAVATDRAEQTYNFTVDGFHTYFVGEAGFWVHNACKPPPQRVPLVRPNPLENTRGVTGAPPPRPPLEAPKNPWVELAKNFLGYVD